MRTKKEKLRQSPTLGNKRKIKKKINKKGNDSSAMNHCIAIIIKTPNTYLVKNNNILQWRRGSSGDSCLRQLNSYHLGKLIGTSLKIANQNIVVHAYY